jgi:hypothetical protein
MELIYLEWIDIQSQDAWADYEEVVDWKQKDWIVKQVGWVFEETDTHVVVVNMICEVFDKVAHITKIPKGTIICRKPISEV